MRAAPIRLICTALLFLLVIGNTGEAAPARARPYSGRGLLIIKGLPQDTSPERVVIYSDPGVGRLADMSAADLPLLTRIVQTGPGEYPVAVMGQKGNWVQIAYDDGGRTGWLEMQRRWSYLPWEEVLPGRSFSLLPGLRKEFYAVQAGPFPSASTVGTRAPAARLQAESVRREWLGFALGDHPTGWIRWRDESGRFLITLSGNEPQNR